MLTSISWTQFIVAVTAALFSYYSISILLLYSKEIKAFFNSRPKSPSMSNFDEDRSLATSDDLMGHARQQQQSQMVSRGECETVSDVQFSPAVSNDALSDAVESEVEDGLLFKTLIEEVDALFDIIRHSTKEQSTPLFQLFIQRNNGVTPTIQLALSRFIFERCKDRCDFEFELSEINSWWTTIK